jgi:hypothetical protein
MKSRRIERHSDESGFALLLVFVMAAAISITMFIEVPRIAFESQRAREQMAIDRGLQYKRAIQLFYRKYQTFPQTLDDLETTRNIRFLRHRYLDPLTGKEWRLLHVGPAGQLTDSLVQPPAPLPGSTTGSGPNSGQSSFQIGPSQTPGSSQTASTQSANPTNPSQPVDPNDPNSQQPPDPLNMAARRPSDRIIGGPGGTPGGAPGGIPGIIVAPDGQTPQSPDPDPNQPQQPFPGQPVQQPGDPNQPVVPIDPSQPQVPGQPAIPGQPVAPQSPSQPAVQFPPGLNPGATPGQTPPGTSSPQNPGFQQMPGQQGVVPFGQASGQLGQAGQATPGIAPPAQSAANMIQQILTTPRQPPSSVPGFTTGSTGGIAGVASTADGKGIHVINDHTKYKEWEFYYDLKKDKTVVGAAAVNQQQQVQQQMQQNGANGPLGNSPFSSNSSGSSPFSSTPTNSGSSSTPAAPAAPTTPPPTQ